MVDVCMLVANEARTDPRVVKEARSLTRAGYSVAVVGLTRGEDTGWETTEDGYQLRRVRPEGFSKAKIKKNLSSRAPGTYRLVTKVYRKARGIPNRPLASAPPPATGVPPPPSPDLPEAERQRLARQRGMLIGIRSHDDQSRSMALAAIMSRPSVVHAHDLNTLRAGVWAARATGAALVFDSHEIWWQQHAEGVAPEAWIEFYRALEAELMPRADQVITVCDSIADFFRDLHGIERPAVVRNSIELPPGGFVSPDALHAPNDPVEVLFHGGFSQNRGLEELIDAVPHFESARLVLRGFGPLREPLEARIAALGVGDRVEFREPVPMADVPRAASTSDIGIIPYKPVCLNNRFSTPNKLFEYLSGGLAVAASELPEIRRILDRERAGTTFDPYDPKSIAEAINRMAADRAGLARMRVNALAGANAHQNWTVDEQVLLEVYRRLLPRPFGARMRRLGLGRPSEG